MPLDLTKRSEVSSPLTSTQYDADLTAIETAVNAKAEQSEVDTISADLDALELVVDAIGAPSIAAADITDSTAAGAAMITAADAAAQRTLLNVEDGATADQTAAEILTALLTVDGTGTGLDADLLDGNEATAFATSAQGATADTALQPGDIASGTITPRDDDLDLSGGEDGDVLTVQADGSLALETPTAATVNVDQYDIVARITAGTGAAGGLAGADMTEDTDPASGFLFLGWETGGALRTVDVDTLRAEVTEEAVGMVPILTGDITHVFRSDGTWGAPVGVDGLTTEIDSATTITADDVLTLDGVHKRLSATDPVSITLPNDAVVGMFWAATPGDGAVTVAVEGGAVYRLPPGDTSEDAGRTASFVIKNFTEFECIANDDNVSAEWDVWGSIDGIGTTLHGDLDANGYEISGMAGALDMLSPFIEVKFPEEDEVWTLIGYARAPGTIATLEHYTESGTCTVEIAINGTPVTGLSAVSVTSTPASATATAANAYVVGDKVEATFTDVLTGLPVRANLTLLSA